MRASPETDPSPPPGPAAGEWRARMTALMHWLDRRPWLLPVLSFVFGWTCYVLIERGPHLARYAAVVTLLIWPWMLLQNLVGHWLHGWSRGLLSPRWTAFMTQSLQQEMLFFALPFVIGALQPNLGHALFALIVGLAALFSTIDPLYHRWAVERPAGSVAFQTFCTFLTALVVLPVALHVPVDRAVPLAIAVALASTIAGLPRLLQAREGRGWRAPTALVSTLALLALGLPLRPWIPPVGLHLSESRITQSIEELAPGPQVKQLRVGELGRGVIAYVAVHAPTGLSQELRFDWHHQGHPVDSIPARVEGAEGRGWRTYTRKSHFPDDPRGAWRVDLRTPGDQLIGRLYFRVID